MQPRCAQPPENTLPGSIPKPLRHGYLHITCSRLSAIFALFPVLSLRVLPPTIKVVLPLRKSTRLSLPVQLQCPCSGMGEPGNEAIPKPLRHGYLYITCSRLSAIFALFPVLSLRVLPPTIKVVLPLRKSTRLSLPVQLQCPCSGMGEPGNEAIPKPLKHGYLHITDT